MTTDNHVSELTGYADRLSVPPGEPIRFMMSTDFPTYEAAVVRLIHGDEDLKGPGFKEEVMATAINREYAGRKQTAYAGSYVLVETHEALERLTSFTLQAWIYPTAPMLGKPQGLLTKWSEASGAGYGLYIGEQGELGLWIGAGNKQIQRVYTGKPLRAREWYFVAASYDAVNHLVRVYQQPIADWPDDASSAVVEKSAHEGPAPHLSPLLIAGGYGESLDTGRVVGKNLYNGKIGSPRIFARALDAVEIERLKQGTSPDVIADLTADWNFAADISSARVTDRGPFSLHGVAVNMPMRAVTGHNWTGDVVDYKQAPRQYNAIHFHTDDLDDAGWEADFEWTVPDSLKSGVYAVRLRAEDVEDYIPFVIRPRKGSATAPAAFLLPTMTYLAYADYGDMNSSKDEFGVVRQPDPDPQDVYLAQHPEFTRSLYDIHDDGSGYCYSSRLRPIVNMRPKYRFKLVGAPRHFAADLYVVDWLEHKGFAHDVITDEDLHFDGLDLLKNYRIVITGTHPEYWTTPMLNALEAYLASGGRLMYLGGNGFYWVTSVDPERPHMIEVRRGIAGTRAWELAPGECYHSTTGELGGLWRYRGKAPNRIAGIGFTAQGWDGRMPGYTRKPGSFDERAAFIFEGVGADETIGDFGLVLGGAAGDELDRVDYDLGTPAHTLVLASSSGYEPSVLAVTEDYNAITLPLMNRELWKVYADMVYFETPNGGEVFSTGSITWCGSLSHNDYDNNVSRITENVLRRFGGY